MSETNINFGKAGKEAVKAVSNGLGRVFGAASDELSTLLTEQMRFWRFKNGARIIANAEQIVRERGIEIETLKKIPYGEQFLLLERATLEEKEEVQDLWSALIANSVDPQSNTQINKRILDILSSLTPPEAGLLKVLAFTLDDRVNNSMEPEELLSFQAEIVDIATKHWRHFPDEEKESAAQNLIRLRCIAIAPMQVDLREVLVELPRGHGQENLGRPLTSVNPQRFHSLLNELLGVIAENSGLTVHEVPKEDRRIETFGWFNSMGPFVKEFTFGLTPLGKEIICACRDTK